MYICAHSNKYYETIIKVYNFVLCIWYPKYMYGYKSYDIILYNLDMALVEFLLMWMFAYS